MSNSTNSLFSKPSTLNTTMINRLNPPTPSQVAAYTSMCKDKGVTPKPTESLNKKSISEEMAIVFAMKRITPVTENQLKLIAEAWASYCLVKSIKDIPAPVCVNNIEASELIERLLPNIPMMSGTQMTLEDMHRFGVITPDDVACITSEADARKIRDNEIFKASYQALKGGRCTYNQAIHIIRLQGELEILETPWNETVLMTFDEASELYSKLKADVQMKKEALALRSTMTPYHESIDSESRSIEADTERKSSWATKDENIQHQLHIKLCQMIGCGDQVFDWDSWKQEDLNELVATAKVIFGSKIVDSVCAEYEAMTNTCTDDTLIDAGKAKVAISKALAAQARADAMRDMLASK